MSDKIIITDPKILSYYTANKNIDIVTINHIFIDILNKLSTNISDITNETINGRILQIVTDINSNMNSIKLDFLLKLQENKTLYVDEIKTILNTNSLSHTEKLNMIIEKNNETLINKTNLLMNDIIPKNQERSITFIENSIKTCCAAINSDTQKLLSINYNKSPEDTTKTIIENVENQLNRMINSVQQPILHMIQTSEERQNTSMNQIREIVSIQNNTQKELSSEINNFIGRYKNKSQFKGSVAETELYFMIQNVLPTSEIINTTSSTASCDYCVKRKGDNKPDILFESKDYTNTVPTDEIDKFKRDLQLQKCHGILVSQNSPITFKSPFHIDIINGLIHVYIPNTEYNIDKLKIGIDIIDNIHQKLIEFEHGDDKISKSQLDDILEEYKQFSIKKTRMFDTIKTLNKQLNDQLEDIQLPTLKLYLIQKGKIENDTNLECPFCCFTGKNKASLSAHKKGCKFNPNPKKNDDNENLEPVSIAPEPLPEPISSTPLAITPVVSIKASRKKNILA